MLLPIGAPVREHLAIKQQPEELLRCFFDACFQRLTEAGLTLEIASFSQLHRLNRDHRASWRPLLSTFQPTLGGARDDSGCVFFGRNASGEVIATQAVRLFNWSDTNFKREAESLRLFYRVPEIGARPGERCVVTARNAAAVSGRLAMSGAGWYRPDYRGRKLGHFLPRMSRVLAYASGHIDGGFALFSDDNVTKRLPFRAGFKNVEPGVRMCHSRSFPDGELRMWLGHQSSDDIIRDVYRCLVDGLPQIDTRVAQRRA